MKENEQIIILAGMRVKVIHDESELCEGCAFESLGYCLQRRTLCTDENGNTSMKFIKV